MRPSASFSSFALLPLSSVNTLRSVLPARYGQGAGLVTKKRGKRNGADTRKGPPDWRCGAPRRGSDALLAPRSEEHTSELQSLMRISYAVFCLKKKTHQTNNQQYTPNVYKHNQKDATTKT